jgi:hypothetical protein
VEKLGAGMNIAVETIEIEKQKRGEEVLPFQILPGIVVHKRRIN